jgi:predicted dehydrogenase
MRKVKFGIIGCGLMGKEFAGAVSRWHHLNDDIPCPEILAVSDTNQYAVNWFKERIPSVKHCFSDYKELLADPEIEAVYCAVPHHLHKQIYVDIINAKKHFMGEKPFGIDKEANEAIIEAIKNNPGFVVRCASEFPYYPACQKLISYLTEGRLGRIIEAYAGFNHSSDMDIAKPINWKRKAVTNGEYGCMGDLGIHTQHIPFRLGWKPKNVCAKLLNIVTERPDGKGGMATCDTWDNATLVCDMENRAGEIFPMTFEMKRMKPGATNDWYLEVYGLKCSVRFSTNDANAFYFAETSGKEQAWCRVVVGSKPLFPTATGDIFEFGFSDSILQMWAAFMKEIDGQSAGFSCFTPEETIISHELHTAALISNKESSVIKLGTPVALNS